MNRRTIQVQKITTFTGHRDAVYSLEKSDKDEVFFSAAGDGMVVAWNLENSGNGELIAQVPTSVYALRYVPSKDWLLLGHNHNSLQVINLSKKEVLATIALPPVAIFDIIWSEKTQLIYVALGDGGLAVADANTFTLKNLIKLSSKSARCLALNEITQEIAIGFSDHVIRVLDLTTLALKFEFSSHTNSVFTVTYSPDGRFLLSGSRDAHLKV
ncbi:MAG: WD40 repeat domain-containing protein, partial [Bacteroidota bacterium]|nr:WD40 repeat domain-containing protein [Bacteroidota bacterium]